MHIVIEVRSGKIYKFNSLLFRVQFSRSAREDYIRAATLICPRGTGVSTDLAKNLRRILEDEFCIITLAREFIKKLQKSHDYIREKMMRATSNAITPSIFAVGKIASCVPQCLRGRKFAPRIIH